MVFPGLSLLTKQPPLPKGSPAVSNTLNERFMEAFGIDVFEIMESCTDFTVEFFKQKQRRGQYRGNQQSSSSVSCYIDCYCAAYDTTERFENRSSCPSLGDCPDASSAQGDKIKVYNVSMAAHWKKVGGTCR